MAKTSFQSVDEYIAAQPEAVRGVLTRVRAAIRKAVPEAGEMISYQVPGYKLNNKPVVYFAAWKQHYAIYPASALVKATLKDDLARYTVANSTIRFPFEGPVPVKLIGRIAKLRAMEALLRIGDHR